MARICIDEKSYVVNIHCGNKNDHEEDTRAIWSNFIYANKNRMSELVMFKPGISIIGLIRIILPLIIFLHGVLLHRRENAILS